jgi:hypothetical protein
MISNYNYFNRAISAAVFLVTSILLMNFAVAAEQEYNIELVILEDLSGKYSASENWPAGSELVTMSSQQKPDTEAEQNRKRIRFLADDSYKLNDEVKRIEESNEYKVLLHVAWRQAGLDKADAFPIHLSSLNQQNTTSDSYIEGDITFVMSRYLHVSGEMTFYQAKQGGFLPYPVKFDRRMRSRETHYIDHPIVGILVLATPIAR